MEFEAQRSNDEDNQNVRDQTGQDARAIVGRVLGTEDRRSDDAADAAAADQSG